MRKIALGTTVLLAVVIAACVTINVYFPEAAAVDAADRIIDKVRGEDSAETTSHLGTGTSDPILVSIAGGISRLLISDANAQAPVDFDRPSPEKQSLENSLAARFSVAKALV